MPLTDVGSAMSWSEAWDLTHGLAGDPTSCVGAELSGWDHPWTWEAIVLADLYDRFVEANTGKGKPKPYPRPWGATGKRVTKSKLTQEETLAALRYAGHTNLPGVRISGDQTPGSAVLSEARV